MAVTVVVAYDIASNSRRSRVSAALQSWGYRIQESVFQVSLEEKDLTELVEEVSSVIEDSDDVVHVYRLCQACRGRVRVLGTAPTLDDGGLYRGLW